MSKTPPAFAAMRAQEEEQYTRNREINNRVREQEEREEQTLFNAVVAALTPYVDCELDGLPVTVTFEKNKTAKFFIDGNHWLTFIVERTYYHCHCENACDCDTPSSVRMSVKQHRKKPGYENYSVYFSCYESDLNNGEKFARAIAEMLRDYVYSVRFPSLY